MKKQNVVISQLRRNRRISQASLAAGITSREAVSHFESRGTNISANTLFQFLEKMNIFPEEYYFLLHENNLTPKQGLALEGFNYTQNSREKNDYLIRLEQLYQQTNDIFYLLIKYQFILYYGYKDGLDLSQLIYETPKQGIKNHLNLVEDWGHFEISLLNNTLFAFDSDYILNIFEGSITKMRLYTHAPYYKKDIETFLVNTLSLFWDRGQFAAMGKLLLPLNNLTDDPAYLFGRIMFRIYDKVARYKDDFCGADIQTELNMLNELGFNNISDGVLFHFKKYKANN